MSKWMGSAGRLLGSTQSPLGFKRNQSAFSSHVQCVVADMEEAVLPTPVKGR